MPCHSDYSDYDNTQRTREAMNKLTCENDMLRDALLNMINDRNYELPVAVIKVVQDEQIKHRKSDLKRLEKVFRESRDAEKLGLVLLADPRRFLEPQLGFNPDAY